MFGSLGAPEILLIFIVALMVFGPKRLPEIGRKIGGIARDLRRSTGDFRATVEREIGLDPASTGVEDVRRARRDLLSAVSDPLKDAASGAMGAVRDFREAVILPPDRPILPPPGAVPGTPPAGAGSPAPAPPAPLPGLPPPAEAPARPAQAPAQPAQDPGQAAEGGAPPPDSPPGEPRE